MRGDGDGEGRGELVKYRIKSPYNVHSHYFLTLPLDIHIPTSSSEENDKSLVNSKVAYLSIMSAAERTVLSYGPVWNDKRIHAQWAHEVVKNFQKPNLIPP